MEVKMSNTKTFAYVRVSTKEQKLDRQLDAIMDYCKSNNVNIEERDIFLDKESGKNFERQGYIALKQCLRAGDTLIVKELDRLGRNKEQVKQELAYFKQKGIRIKVLNIPTTLIDFPTGQEWVLDMVNNILIEVLAAIAEEERIKTKQRQEEGIAALKKRNDGKGIGRPKIKKPENFYVVVEQWKRGEITATKSMQMLNLKRNTFYKFLKEEGI